MFPVSHHQGPAEGCGCESWGAAATPSQVAHSSGCSSRARLAGPVMVESQPLSWGRCCARAVPGYIFGTVCGQTSCLATRVRREPSSHPCRVALARLTPELWGHRPPLPGDPVPHSGGVGAVALSLQGQSGPRSGDLLGVLAAQTTLSPHSPPGLRPTAQIPHRAPVMSVDGRGVVDSRDVCYEEHVTAERVFASTVLLARGQVTLAPLPPHPGRKGGLER